MQVSIFKILLLCGLAIVALFIKTFADNRTVIVFCDVGQGDATYIRVKNKVDILVDAGPDKKVLSCLGRYMPFFDREIEYAFLTHPQKDHYGGFLYLVDRYQINNFISSEISGNGITWRKFTEKLKEKSIAPKPYYAFETLKIDDFSIKFLWPEKDYVKRFSGKNKQLNDFSQVFLFFDHRFKALFTGDITHKMQNRLLDRSIARVDLLKVPHHGSKYDLNAKFLELADPRVSVISAGQDNRYGHPSKAVLDSLEAINTQIRRTDIEGNVVLYLN